MATQSESMTEPAAPILDVRRLTVSFRAGLDEVTAVKSIDFELHRGETLAILGESGSGKSVSASAIMGILDSPMRNAIVKVTSLVAFLLIPALSSGVKGATRQS